MNNDSRDMPSVSTKAQRGSAYRAADNPFLGSRGLVGGSGEKRKHRHNNPYEHPLLLRPYDVPEHITVARQLFANGPIEVEIGFGRSHFFRDRVLQAPETQFLGFEIKLEWVRRVAKFLAREDRMDCRVVLDDARPLLLQLLPEESVRVFYVFFPDPWWKKRHHKRRIMTQEMLDVMYRLLEPGGAIELRTDVRDYFARVDELFQNDARYERIEPGIDQNGQALPLTHREKKCRETGIDTYSLRARKASQS
ncbi:MAG: tRNA (guanosine(46)-N7)-methyltransferase TrmB [Myxococcota bacterium]|nr:tRNA (guanosine(46)-N7)-methyltransferase TrmB [Myxococcota bacterium]